MGITGKLFIDGAWVQGEAGSYRAHNPATGKAIAPAMSMASSAQVEAALAAAAAAAPIFRNSSLQQRADFLRLCADEIMALGAALLERVTEETGYPAARGEGERARTCGQLRLFADTIVKGEYLDARIDTALPDRKPAPRPDLRHVNQAIGPVVVFGASNFPLAYSVAGGDTAAALAAGCPVLVKGHSSHPGTSELVAQAMATALAKSGLPKGVFSLLMGAGAQVGAALVQAPAVKAVGFTGSFAGGMALVELANARAEPIPVFAEMGSINPVVLLPGALQERAADIGKGFVGSLTLGTGQFCVNPGLVIAIDDAGLQTFIDAACKLVTETQAGVMLNERICSAYSQGLAEYAAQKGVDVLASGGAPEGRDGYCGQATLMTTSAANFLQNPKIHDEVFGPASLVVKCRDKGEIMQVLSALKGQLTGTIHCAEGELAKYRDLADLLTLKVGRIVINGFPTGVEVCHAMVHGGPFPATTDARFTAVGTNSIKRFVRPVCYQGFPDAFLPEALRNANPLGLLRLVNGERNGSAI
jgi:NADP-dependent aldehyde dehydrogenase